MTHSDLEQLIRSHVPFVQTSSTGFNTVVCRVCNDHGRKGPRAGFKFLPDGTIIYNCFNEPQHCNAVYNPNESLIPTRKFFRVLESYGITRDQVNQCLNVNSLQAYVNSKLSTKKQTIKHLNYHEFNHPILSHLTPINELEENEYVRYLRERRIDREDWNLFYSYSGANTLYAQMIWIKIFYRGFVVGVQGRSINNHTKKRYVTLTTNSPLVFNLDELYRDTTTPIVITEGIFDALMFPTGIAVLSNNITRSVLDVLNQTNREIIIVPDYPSKKEKTTLIDSFEKLTKCYVPLMFSPSCKDANEYAKRYGRIKLAKQVKQTLTNDLLKIKLHYKL